MAQKYSLKWDHHQENLTSMFSMLRHSHELVDVTLAVEGQQIHAHKMVLAACSPYFHSIFAENPLQQHPIVFLRNVSFSILNAIIDFMYYGEVSISQENLPEILDAAKSLKVKGFSVAKLTPLFNLQSSDTTYQASDEQIKMQIEKPLNILFNPSNEPYIMSKPPVWTASPTVIHEQRNSSSGSSSSPSMVIDESGQGNQTMETSDGYDTYKDMSYENEVTQTVGQDYSDLNAEHNISSVENQWRTMENSYIPQAGQAEGECVADMIPGNDRVTPPTKRHRANPQGTEHLQEALEAVRSGYLSYVKAARIYGVSNHMLWLECKKRGYISIQQRPTHMEPKPSEPEQQLWGNQVSAGYVAAPDVAEGKYSWWGE